LGALTSAELATLYASPLVLDLDGDGIRTVGLAGSGVRFDLDGDGKQEWTGWVGSGDGLLARDLDGDGQIDDGRELFGEGTQLGDGRRAVDGFEALSALDENGDGRVDGADAGYASLVVWRDADADGVTDAGELLSLGSLGIVSLSTQARVTTQFDAGNYIGLTSGYERADGTQGELADVWFRVSSAEVLEERAQALGDALAGYATAGAEARADKASGAVPVVSGVVPVARGSADRGDGLGADGRGVREAVAGTVDAVAALGEQLRSYQVAQTLQAVPSPTGPAGLLGTATTAQGLMERQRPGIDERALSSSGARGQPDRLHGSSG
jgi:hypothetical protein